MKTSKPLPKPILTPDNPKEKGCEDYTLRGSSVWIAVGNRVVHILKHNGILSASIYEEGNEAWDPVDRCAGDVRKKGTK